MCQTVSHVKRQLERDGDQFLEQPFFQPSNLYSGVVFNAAGNLYGATLRGAGTSTLYDGTVYKLTPAGNGTWTNATLFAFGANHGATPGVGSLVFDSSGSVYGATQAGGKNKAESYSRSHSSIGWRSSFACSVGNPILEWCSPIS